MKALHASRLDASPALELLEHAFGAHSHEGPGSHGLAPQLWERALLAPLRDFLSRPGKELRARLVELGYSLGGGVPHMLPPELPWLIELLHAGSLIVDDIEDDSAERRGQPALHRLHGLPVALNAGNWLYFWPQVVLSRIPLPPTARLEAHERIAECLLRCHEGQALDLTVAVSDLQRAEVPRVVHTVTTLKTGKLVGLATGLGAIAALATSRRVDALARFGCNIGVGLQMLDDLSGVLNPQRRDKALEDLRSGRATWVWAWLAEDLDDESYAAALQTLAKARSGDLGACDAVLEQARFRLAMTGLRRVRRRFDDALATLEEAIGNHGWVLGVRSDLDWLERQFLGAP